MTARPEVVATLARRRDVAAVVPDTIDLVPAAVTDNQAAVRAPEAWSSGTTGRGVVVATLDSGVDPTDPDLAARWRGGTNSWYDPYDQHPSAPTDLSGHGTGVTGVMVGGSGSGSAVGTAPDAQWIAARVFNDAGAASVSAVHAAFQWVLDPDHDPSTADAPHVVDASWSIGSGPGCDLTFRPDVLALRAAGILPVFPAGNFGPGQSSSVSPANYPESLSVGGVDATGRVVGSSSRGPSTCGGRARVFPDVVAPGKNVYTTDRYGFFQVVQGTSVAAPHAAGLLALLLSASPGLTADQQWSLITTTSRDLGVVGPDETYGNGLVDAVELLAASPPPVPPDFAVSLTPAQATVEAGSSASWVVGVTPDHGFDQDVALAVTAPPALGATSLSPATVAGGTGQATLTIATTAATVPGTYPVSLSATSGTLVHVVDGTVTVTAPPPPPPPPPPPAAPTLQLSTYGNVNPPGLSGSADDADVLQWDGTSYARVFDASAHQVPSRANLDGLDVVDGTHFYASFATDTRLPGLGTVQDEDVVHYSDGTWSVWFDGTAHGLTSAGADIDALSVSVSDGTLSFSTLGNVNPPGVSGTADDADVYTWDGRRFARAWDASAAGLPSSANLDGLVRAGPDRLWISSSIDTVVPGIGKVQDEDVLELTGSSWSVWFDGTAHGLTSSAADVDAFDVVG